MEGSLNRRKLLLIGAGTCLSLFPGCGAAVPVISLAWRSLSRAALRWVKAKGHYILVLIGIDEEGNSVEKELDVGSD